MRKATAMRRAPIASLLAVGVAVTAVALGAAWGVRELNRPWSGWPGESVTVELSEGMPAGTMIRALGEARVVRKPTLLKLWLRWKGGDETLHAGEYRFEHPSTPIEVLERLRRGDVVLHAVTVPEGLTLVETARRIADAGFADEDALFAAFSDPAPILDFDPEAGDLEGYLFPDTYRFPRGETAPRIMEALVGRFREMAGPDYDERAGRAGLSLRQAVVLASLIEKETSLPSERPRISRVFHNRLDREMPLQCDPTVIYALRRDGIEVRALSRRDLAHQSPWNTYVHVGLPPGPICSPGRDSLLAALDPSEGDELYFVASPDGGHRFSATLEGHLRAVREWRDYSRSSR